MNEQVTFIHAADLHIGAPFRGMRDVSKHWADRLLHAIPEAFHRLIDAACESNVDFVVLAGDIFDLTHPSYCDYLLFYEGMNRLARAHIPVYMCTGNHDPYTTWAHEYLAPLPDNVYMFSAEDQPSFTVFERDGQPLVLLGGRGYYNQTFSREDDISRGITRENAECICGVTAPFALGVIHTGLDIDKAKAPTNPKTLLAAGMDYWCLGHIHSRVEDDSKNPHVVFPGCIQGRAMHETGEHGVLEVHLEKGMPNSVTMIPTASIVWEQPRVDISECSTFREIVDEIMAASFAANGNAKCEEMITRVKLIGATDLHEALDKPDALEDLRNAVNDSYDKFFCESIVDRTTLPIDKEALRKEALFPTALIASSDEMKDDRAATIAYLDEMFRAKGISMPKRFNWAWGELCDNAFTKAFDELAGGDQ